MIWARAFLGLKKLLNKSGLIQVWARLYYINEKVGLRPEPDPRAQDLVLIISPSPNFGLRLRPDPSLQNWSPVYFQTQKQANTLKKLKRTVKSNLYMNLRVANTGSTISTLMDILHWRCI